eukprot:6183831-Pleurochrysis_carterae.AAC.4
MGGARLVMSSRWTFSELMTKSGLNCTTCAGRESKRHDARVGEGGGQSAAGEGGVGELPLLLLPRSDASVQLRLRGWTEHKIEHLVNVDECEDERLLRAACVFEDPARKGRRGDT